MVELFRDIPHEEYLSWPFMSQSTIKKIDESIPEYLAEFMGSDATRLGDAFHSAILTPEDGRTIIEPPGNKKLNAFRELLEMFHRANSSKTIITTDQKETLALMIKSFNSHPMAVEMLTAATDIEVCAFVEFEGIKFKCRADVLTDLGVVDIKSTRDASPRWFWRSVRDLGYDVQAFLYRDAFDAERFFIIATENNGHHITQCYEISDKTFKYGRERLMRCIDKYKMWEASEDKPKTYTGTWEIESV